MPAKARDKLPSLAIFPACTDRSMPILELAKEAEARGFSGIFLNEHTHMPVDHSTSKFPAGGATPDRYGRFWCPFAALAFVAAQTSLEVGTSVSLVGEHDAIALAKTIATLDVLSEGRFVFGVGWGWNREEFEDHGHAANQRAQLLEESVALMRALWTEEVAAFDGEFFRMRPSYAWPKPCQQPHPPVFLGVPGNERNYKRVARFADGWMPMAPVLSSEHFAHELDQIKREMEAAGRDPACLRLRVIETSREVDIIKRNRDAAASLGVEAVHILMQDDPRDIALAILDDVAKVLH